MSSGSSSSFKSRLTAFPLPALGIVVIAQTAVHLALLREGKWIGDTRLLQTWAKTLAGHPTSSFYATQKRADHLPGDLWILHLEAWVYRLVSGHAPSNTGFLKALELGPALADIGLAVVLYLIAREIGDARVARVAALLFALNPAPYFISVVWGVADSVSMLFAALAIWLTVRRWFWAAAPALTFACLIKPQLGVLAPLLLIFFLHEALGRARPARLVRPAAELVIGAVASIGVLLIALTPFNVGIPLFTQRWSLIERMKFSADLYSKTTLNALNLWAFLAARGLRFPSINAPSDNAAGLFGLSYQYWGIALTGIVCFVLTLPLIRKGGAERLVWTCATVAFAFFMLQTRIHERYFFPAIALMALATAARTRWIAVYVVMSGVYFANVWWVFRWLEQQTPRGGRITGGVHDVFGHLGLGGSSGSTAISDNLVRLTAGLNLMVLASFVISALVDVRRAETEPVSAAISVPDPAPTPEWPSWPAASPASRDGQRLLH